RAGVSPRKAPRNSYGMVLGGPAADKEICTKFLQKTGASEKYDFLINSGTRVFERLFTNPRPPQDDIARIWAFTGMQTGEKKPKPASAQWDAYYRAKLVRVW